MKLNAVIEKLNRRIDRINSLVCVGLDSDLDSLPMRFQQEFTPQFVFNRWLIDQTQEYAVAYKPNMAFYEARGEEGIRDLRLTLEYLRSHHPDILTICDAKRADIGSTNKGYVKAIFDTMGFDAVTLHPYLGQEALLPFLERDDKVCIILCRTSNPGAGELQDLVIAGKRLWEVIAEHVVNDWNKRGNCMLVVGATYPDELRRIREIAGIMPLLVPGVGAQGGDVQITVEAGIDSEGRGILVNASRSIIFADSPLLAAQTLRDEINQYR